MSWNDDRYRRFGTGWWWMALSMSQRVMPNQGVCVPSFFVARTER